MKLTVGEGMSQASVVMSYNRLESGLLWGGHV